MATKGLTIEISGDTTKLSTALRNLNAPINQTQKELKQVERLLKLDPTNTELLAQKHKLLGTAVEQTKTKLAALKEAAKQAEEQLKQDPSLQGQYDALQREIEATEISLRELEQQASKSNVSMLQLSAAAGKVADVAGKVAEKTKAMSAAAGGALAGLAGLAYSAVTGADDLNTLAKQSGFTTEELQKLQYASDRLDVSVEDVTSAAQKLKKNMGSGSDSVTSAFQQLGVSVTDASGHMRSSTEVFWDVVNALSRVQNETERDQLAMELLGRSADSLAGIIDDGGRAFRDLGDEAERAGLIMSQETLDGLNAVNDELDKVKATAAASLKIAGAKALEAFLPVLQKIIALITQLLTWLGNLDSRQMTILVTILAIVAAISPIAGIISAIAGAVSALLPLLSVIFGFFAANPIVIAIAAIAALVALLVYQIIDGWDELKFAAQLAADAIREKWQAFCDWYISIWQAIGEAVKAVFQGFVAMGQSIANGLVSIVERAVNNVIGLLNGVINMINSVASAVASLFGMSFGGISTIGAVSLPRFANGGSLTSGSALVGKAGPELLTVSAGRATVTPLNTPAAMSAAPAAAGGSFHTSVDVKFSGSLAQLAAVLQPAIVAETTRLGPNISRN